jgi:hypothetical protein
MSALTNRSLLRASVAALRHLASRLDRKPVAIAAVISSSSLLPKSELN